jgi:asparagine synthase (glutamine-hydrolysing)
MCGFVATFRRGGAVDRDRLAAALDAIGHRGPDGRGVTFAPLAGPDGAVVGEAGFAHARLAILDLDPRSDQPFRLGAHRLVYNGELYNHRSLGPELARETAGDTEALLRLLANGGLDALEAANGMWSFCWLDGARGRMVAGRDRYGKKPLFYAVEADALHFASEPRALAVLTGRPLAMRRDALAAFLADGWLFPSPDGATHLDGICEVPPGQALNLDLASWTISLRQAFRFADPPEDLGEETLAATLADAVEARLISDRRVGLFLSGGVDSSLILSILASRGLADGVVCVTGDAGRSDDAAYAEACVRALGIQALKVPLPYDAFGFEQFLAVCRAQAKPFPLIGNVLGMPALYRAMAERDIPVVLDGTGADEIFGGYWSRYAGFALDDARRADDRRWIQALQPPDKVRLSGREGVGAADAARLLPEMRATVSAMPARDPLVGPELTLSEALNLDATAGRMQEWLWQNDRNAMASGIENRSPFLDHRLLAWAATPYRAKFGEGWNKRELRALFKRFRPLPTADRRSKQGFRWAYGPFFRENREAILTLLEGSHMVRSCVDVGAFADAWRGGAIGSSDPLLHRLTVLAGLEATGLGLSEAAGAVRHL